MKLAAALVALALVACGGADGSDGDVADGMPEATGGLPAGTGGAPAVTGGATATGGGVATGGSPAASGGTSSATGGTTSTGGAVVIENACPEVTACDPFTPCTLVRGGACARPEVTLSTFACGSKVGWYTSDGHTFEDGTAASVYCAGVGGTGGSPGAGGAPAAGGSIATGVASRTWLPGGACTADAHGCGNRYGCTGLAACTAGEWGTCISNGYPSSTPDGQECVHACLNGPGDCPL